MIVFFNLIFNRGYVWLLASLALTGCLPTRQGSDSSAGTHMQKNSPQCELAGVICVFVHL